MKSKLIALVLLFCLLSSINSCDSVEYKYKEYEKYVGDYSHKAKIFDDSIINNEMIRILGEYYEEYKRHITLSGSGKIETTNRFIYGDVSQLHVGGYCSIWFFDISNGKMYLFWINNAINESEIAIFGDNPIPREVINTIISKMNIAWGHVARFSRNRNKIVIHKKET